jgi:hypothetical protein
LLDDWDYLAGLLQDGYDIKAVDDIPRDRQEAPQSRRNKRGDGKRARDHAASAIASLSSKQFN